MTIANGSINSTITWRLENDGTMYIEGTGAMTDYASASDAPWYANRANITHVVIGEGITKVGAYAFMDSGVMKAEFSDTVVNIGQFAFSHSFKLIKIVLPNNVQTIGEKAFYKCYIDRLIIPASVTSIGTNAFSFDTANIEQLVICWRGTKVGSIATDANAIVHEFSVNDDEQYTRTYTAGVPNCTRPIMARVSGGWKVIDSSRMMDNTN